MGGRVSHIENIREDQIRTKPIIGGGEDQFKMRQNIADFLYSNFLGRTSQKHHPVVVSLYLAPKQTL